MWKKLLILIMMTLPVSLIAEYFVIKDYQITMDIQENGSMYITEDILVDFSERRRGIYRIIPYRSYVNDKWHEIRISGITSTEPRKVWKEGDDLHIRFGESDVWIPAGEKQYRFSYNVDRVLLTKHEDYDELYWNAIGTAWNVPIYKSSIRVVFPDGLKLQENMQYRLYIGPEGSTTEYHDYELDDWKREEMQESHEGLRESRFITVEGYAGISQDINGNMLIIKNRNKLNPRNGITLQIRMKKGVLVKTAWQYFIDFFHDWLHFILTGLLFLASLLIWNRYGKDGKVSVMVEYFPPQVSPSEAASILKQSSSFNLSATLVDLARRGYIVIGEEQGGKKYLERVSPGTQGLRSYEKELMTRLFNDSYTDSENDDRVYTDDLTNVFHTDYDMIENDFNGIFDKKGYFKKAGNKWRGMFIFLIVIAFVTLFLGFFFASIPRKFNIFLLLSIVNNAIFAWIMPQKSEKGLAVYRQILGFKEFIRRAEKEKIMRLFNQDRKYFDETIAFAMALGLAGKWSRMFDNLMKEPPHWYRGYTAYDSYRMSRFIHSLNATVRDISTQATSTPSSSGSGSSWSGGGGSWGGSSGGGFGGGGGGSW